MSTLPSSRKGGFTTEEQEDGTVHIHEHQNNGLTELHIAIAYGQDTADRIVRSLLKSEGSERQELPFPWSEYDATQLNDLLKAIGIVSMALGNPAMCAGPETTIESQLLQYAAGRFADEKKSKEIVFRHVAALIAAVEKLAPPALTIAILAAATPSDGSVERDGA